LREPKRFAGRQMRSSRSIYLQDLVVKCGYSSAGSPGKIAVA